MRIAVISDIHSNLEALQMAIAMIEEKNVDKIICLGDIVGYGANPKECLKIVTEKSSIIIMGNHDRAAANIRYAEKFSSIAHMAIVWTSKILSDDEKEILKSFTFTEVLNDIFFVHASPRQPNEWNYILSYEDALQNFKYFKHNICFIGHSHISDVFCEDKKENEKIKNLTRIRCFKDKKYIINVGSIGQPRDRNPCLSFGIFDSETCEYENLRFVYDVNIAAKKILDAGLPSFLANRITKGS